MKSNASNGLGQGNKGIQSKYQLKAKSVGEKNSLRRNQRWENPQEWRKVGVRIGLWRERESTLEVDIGLFSTNGAHFLRMINSNIFSKFKKRFPPT